MEKETYALVKTKLSFMDKIKFSLSGKKPECKSIVEQAEKIVEEYILNCRLQGITLYKKKKKMNFKKTAVISILSVAVAVIAYLIFV